MNGRASNASSAVINFSPDFDAWLVTGVDDNSHVHSEQFRGENGKCLAIAHAIKHFKFVSVIEST